MQRGIALIVLLLTLGILPVMAQKRAKPPTQPISGPGSSALKHADTTRNRYGNGGTEYFLFEPTDPKPQSAPVIVFVHGFGAVNPAVYGAWIDRIVRRGNIVIYPRYQIDNRTPAKEYTPNAITAIKDALNRLQNEAGHVLPELERFAIVGHSAGGIITANIAAQAISEGLPAPRAIMSVAPGRSMTPSFPLGIPLADLSQIPGDALLLTVVGDIDQLAGDADAKNIFQQTIQIPLTNKDYIIVQTDSHGFPPLLADHGSPSAIDKRYDSGEKINNEPAQLELGAGGGKKSQLNVNALDYYGYWKLFDAICDAAFYGTNREFALGNSEQQRNMGKWSDGVPVKELIVLSNP